MALNADEDTLLKRLHANLADRPLDPVKDADRRLYQPIHTV